MNDDELFARVVAEVEPFTMVTWENLVATLQMVLEAVDSDRPGDLVECGTWLGGASFAMLLVQRYRYGRIVKPVWMLDSFQGLPPAAPIDGPAALDYSRDSHAPGNHDNCIAPLNKVREAIVRFGFADAEARVVPGWFADTLPEVKPALATSGISVLRVDCDWYEPVLSVLDGLVPLVCAQGAVIIDDYYSWDGCCRATHDFLSRQSQPWRLQSMDKLRGAFFVKK